MRRHIKNTPGFKTAFEYAIKRGQGIGIETNLKPYEEDLARIKRIDLSGLNGNSLQEEGKRLKRQARQGKSPDDIFHESMALAVETSKRVLGLVPYDVQILAAIVMHKGKLAQMRTGEGKTLAAALTVYCNALGGGGVHVFTANDYLAARDAAWMGKIYDFLGLRSAAIVEKTAEPQRKKAYQGDIIYLTAKQAGFDFLRDSIDCDPKNMLQRDFNMVLVDEADFILIDEARVPMVIAAEKGMPGYDPAEIDTVVRGLESGRDFTIDSGFRTCALTIDGQKRVSAALGCGGIHETEYLDLFSAVHASLHAHNLLHKDKDYIVKDGSIELVDEFTGRVADNRRWPYGIHPALEAKEGLSVRPEGSVRCSITIQNFISLYARIAAMTATAASAAEELSYCYSLSTVVIPPNKTDRLEKYPDRVFLTKKDKMEAIARETARLNSRGRPVLIGTPSIRESEELSRLFAERGLSCSVLNAKDDEKEAEIIAEAGMIGWITVSTNMAGRGTDIKLGGEAGRDREQLTALGGLFVIGTCKHESARIDDQLKGRAGRQGEPGAACCFVSLEDDLILRYGVREFLPKRMILAGEGGYPAGGYPAGGYPAGGYPAGGYPGEITDKRVVREIRRAQGIIEHTHSEMRRTLRRYSLIVERQRAAVRSLRLSALLEGELPELIKNLLEKSYAPSADGIGSDRNQNRIALFCGLLDDFWARHLLFVDDLREGIHLQRYAGYDPFLVFLRETDKAFGEGLDRVCEDAAKAYSDAGNGGIPAEGKKCGPGNTWTYLVNDNPFPGFTLAALGHNNIASALASALLLLGKGIAGLFRPKGGRPANH